MNRINQSNSDAAINFARFFRSSLDKMHVSAIRRISKILYLNGAQRVRLFNFSSYGGRLSVPNEDVKQQVEDILDKNRRFRKEFHHGKPFWYFCIRKIKASPSTFPNSGLLKDEYAFDVVVDPAMSP